VQAMRRTSIATGVLFVVATVTALAAAAVVPALTGTDYLASVAGHSSRLAAAALLYLIAAGTSVGIAIALYPLLKTINVGLALGSVVFRAIEAVFYTVAVVNLLSILPVGQQFATAPADDRAPIAVVADSLVSARELSTLVGVFAFCTGALMYYVLFYRSRLVPRWLSGWGIAAVLTMVIACLFALFRNNPLTGYTLLILPIGIQEMVLAAWLLVKGFSVHRRVPGAVAEGSAAPGGATAPVAGPHAGDRVSAD